MGAEKKWFFTFFSTTFLSLLLLLLYSISAFSSPRPFFSLVQRGPHCPPAFGYYIFGGKGDKDRIFRLLLAVYHPRNRYLLHLGAEASDEEKYRLTLALKSVPAIRSFGNVDVKGKPDRFSYMGSTHIAATLHAASVLMKVDRGWDWFITLSALDYLLVTQDDLSHVFSSVRRDLNFLDHTSDLGLPMGHLKQILLMYFNNVMLSEESYFHSVICNSPEFKNTTVNSDLRYMIWDNPPKMEPHFLNVLDYDQMAQSGGALARQFKKHEPLLDMVDKKILKRNGRNQVAPGAWCTGRNSWWSDPCTQWGDVNVLKPGPQAKKLQETITNLLDDWSSQSNQCT
ncbi:Pentatricopeptide repeat-containing protein, putative isoform 1 [Hibiscus syriacus]|uniref:Pentatricopeptide repeat-containing protein, putative isoform 1 n=1 Tax=Hibiscus syriacus TaxID=106335 RepID=A0A6A3C632_HIBSY|nr:Pentatricopeptide repeat-containing protein, putative isoform 1 [Hibiscus syriacus]